MIPVCDLDRLNEALTLAGLPLTSEWRLIYRNGVYSKESGFYWPKEVYKTIKRDGVPVSLDEAETIITDLKQHFVTNRMDILSDRVVKALGGDWSVDWMLTDRGFVLIDMALANESWIPNPTTPPPAEPEIDYSTIINEILAEEKLCDDSSSSS